MKKVKEYVESEGKSKEILTGGDLNARTGEEGGGYWGGKEEG